MRRLGSPSLALWTWVLHHPSVAFSAQIIVFGGAMPLTTWELEIIGDLAAGCTLLAITCVSGPRSAAAVLAGYALRRLVEILVFVAARRAWLARRADGE